MPESISAPSGAALRRSVRKAVAAVAAAGVVSLTLVGVTPATAGESRTLPAEQKMFAIDCTGNYPNLQLFGIDSATAEPTAIGAGSELDQDCGLGAGWNPTDDTIYFVAHSWQFGQYLASVDTETGASQFEAVLTSENQLITVDAFTIAADGDAFAFGRDDNSETGNSLFSVDLATGALTRIGDAPGNEFAMASDPSTGKLYAASSDGTVFSVDEKTGDQDYVGDVSKFYTPAPNPDPEDDPYAVETYAMAIDYNGVLWVALESEEDEYVQHLWSADLDDIAGSAQHAGNLYGPGDTNLWTEALVITGARPTTPATPITWTDTTIAKGAVGVPYSDSVTATGATSYSILSGALPSGLTLSTDGKISGVADSSGSGSVTIKASNAGSSQSTTIEWVINATLWVDDEVEEGRVGVAYTDGVTAPSVEGATWTYSVSDGELPAGLKLDSKTGAITGTPVESDRFWVDVKATSGDMVFYTGIYSLIHNPFPVWSDTETDKGHIGIKYEDEVAADYAVEYELVKGDLPDGLELAADGTLSGTPTKAGTFTYTVAAYNEAVRRPSRTPMPSKGDKVEHDVTTVIGGAELGLTLEFKAGATAAGSDTRISANGLKPGSAYELWMHSEPVLLDTGIIDESGSFAKNVALPAGIPAGAHELVLTGIAPNGDTVTAKAWFSVDGAGKVVAISYTGPVDNPIVAAIDALASTGVNPVAALWVTLLALLAGAAAIIVTRVRRRA
jgi:hypothetical protein